MKKLLYGKCLAYVNLKAVAPAEGKRCKGCNKDNGKQEQHASPVLHELFHNV